MIDSIFLCLQYENLIGFFMGSFVSHFTCDFTHCCRLQCRDGALKAVCRLFLRVRKWQLHPESLLTPHVGPAGKRSPASHTQVKMLQPELSTLAAVREATRVVFNSAFPPANRCRVSRLQDFHRSDVSNMSLVWFILFLDGSCVWIRISDVIMCGWTLIWADWSVVCSLFLSKLGLHWH